MAGFDAAGHIAEETKKARCESTSRTKQPWQSTTISVIAGRGILTSVIATGFFGFITVMLFLVCTPDLDFALALDAPQPFVQIYALALGKEGSVIMTIIAVIGLIMVCSILWLWSTTSSDGLGLNRIPVFSSLLPPGSYLLLPVTVSSPCRVG